MLKYHEPSISVLDLFDIRTSKGDYVANILKGMCNKKNIIFTNKGRDALYICLKKIGVTKQDEIIMPAYTSKIVKKSINSLCRAVMVDIDIHSLNIDTNKIEKAITKNTKGIVIVHSFGSPSDIGKILEIARKHKLVVIEDCAQSLGAKYKNKFVGYYGDYSFFAFGYAKDLAIFKGGALLSNKEIDYDLKKRGYLKSIIQNFSVFFGMFVIESAPLWFRNVLTKLLVRPYVINNMEVFDFSNEKPSGYDLNLLTKQFKKLDYVLRKKRECAAKYDKLLSEKAHKQVILAGAVSNYFRYPLIVETEKKKILKEKASKKGVGLGGMYDYFNSEPGECLLAERASREIVHLPCHFRVKSKKQDAIIKMINEVI